MLLAVCKIKICKNLKFHVKNGFSQNKLLPENAQLCLSKGTHWILIGNSFVGTPPVRKAFGIRMVNSLKLSFLAHFKNTENNISHNFYSLCVLHRMTLTGHAHFSQFMEWQNLDIKTLKHAIYAPNVFLKLPENQIPTNFIYLNSSNFVTISHINYWDQVNS